MGHWKISNLFNDVGSAPPVERCSFVAHGDDGRPSAVHVQQVSYLVDPASSHMLVSKIKPCMSKYKLLHSETANGSLDQLWFLRSYNPTWITVVILELIHESRLRLYEEERFYYNKTNRC